MEYSKYIEKKERGEKSFWALRESAPEDLQALIHEIHQKVIGTNLLSDWIFRVIHEAFIDLEENGNEYDACEVEADIYYHELYAWFNEGWASDFCDEAIEEGLCDPSKGIMHIISWGNWVAKDRVYVAVHEFLEENSIQGKEVELDLGVENE